MHIFSHIYLMNSNLWNNICSKIFPKTESTLNENKFYTYFIPGRTDILQRRNSGLESKDLL